MCLGVPARVTRVEGEFATIDIEGIKRQACIGLLDEVEVGDYVIVHAGFVISRLDHGESRRTLKLLRQFANENP